MVYTGTPPIQLTATGNGSTAVSSRVHRPDNYISPFNIGLFAVITSGTATFNVEVTGDDWQNPDITPTWFALSTFNAVTSNTVGNIAYPCMGIRVTVSSSSTGTVVLTILQAGTR